MAGSSRTKMTASMASSSRASQGGKDNNITRYMLEERMDVEAAQRVINSPPMLALRESRSQDYRAFSDFVGLAMHLGGSVPVRYFLAAEQHGYGRLRAEVAVEGYKGLPCSMRMQRELRAHLSATHYWDVDMVNTAPSLLQQRCQFYGLESPLLDRYIGRRKQAIEEVQCECDVTYDDAKKLFLRLLFFGTCEGWASEHDLAVERIPSWVRHLQHELAWNARSILDQPDMTDFRAKNVSEKKLPSLMAIHIQTLERSCLEALFTAVQADGREVGALIHDGLHVERLPGEDGLPPLLLERWQRAITTETGFQMPLAVKPFKLNPAWLGPHKKVGSLPVDGAQPSLIDVFRERSYQYSEMKDVWERYACKVVEGGLYVVNDGGCLLIYTRTKLLDAYEHLSYVAVKRPPREELERGAVTRVSTLAFLCNGGQDRSMTPCWLHDLNIRSYQRMDVVPPPQTCPKQVLNLWSGFDVERYHTDRQVDTCSHCVRVLVDHLATLVQRDQPMLEYMLDWTAQMFQAPGVKPGVAVLLVGGQGAGKNRFTDLIKLMMGSDKFLETSKPSDTLYGRFTEPRRNKVCITINEARGSDNHAASDVIKDMITSETFQCEAKGRDCITMRCFARLIFTSNNMNPIKVSSDDRRFVVINVSSEMCGNTDYFKTLSRCIACEHTRHEFYQFLMSRDLSKRDWVNDRPITAYFRELVDMSLEYEYAFLRDALLMPAYRCGGGSLRLACADLFAQFLAWLAASRISKYETNDRKFGHKMSALVDGGGNGRALAGVSKKRRTHGIEYAFDVDSVCADMVSKRWVAQTDLVRLLSDDNINQL